MTTTNKAPVTVWAVPRNNIPAALAFARGRGDALTSDERRVLLRLQDDPAKLQAGLDLLKP